MKILLADDHALFRDGVKQLLAGLFADVEFVEVVDGAALVRLAQNQPDFDLVLIDLTMPEVDGFAGLAAFRQQAPGIPIVVMSASDDAADMQVALAGGAAGFIPKSSSTDVIVCALRLVLAGGIYAPPDMLTGQTSSVSKAQLESLTPRQREVLVLLGQGKANKAIGELLGLSEATVKQHVSGILKTLRVDNRMQAVIAGRQLGRA